jgi:hypothetical protein
MEKMSKKNLLISAVIVGTSALVADLLVELGLYHELLAADYIRSTALGVLVAAAIFILFRNRSGRGHR